MPTENNHWLWKPPRKQVIITTKNWKEALLIFGYTCACLASIYEHLINGETYCELLPRLIGSYGCFEFEISGLFEKFLFYNRALTFKDTMPLFFCFIIAANLIDGFSTKAGIEKLANNIFDQCYLEGVPPEPAAASFLLGSRFTFHLINIIVAVPHVLNVISLI